MSTAHQEPVTRSSPSDEKRTYRIRPVTGGSSNGETLIYRIRPADRRRFDDLCETAARAIAFNAIAEGPLPQVASELMIEASELAGGWDGFDPSAKPGTTPLPIVDEVTDLIHARAAALQRAFSGQVQRACAAAAKSMAEAAADDRMDVSEAADAAGLSKQTIRNYCKWHGIG